jgi:hypothetical protein
MKKQAPKKVHALIVVGGQVFSFEYVVTLEAVRPHSLSRFSEDVRAAVVSAFSHVDEFAYADDADLGVSNPKPRRSTRQASQPARRKSRARRAKAQRRTKANS